MYMRDEVSSKHNQNIIIILKNNFLIKLIIQSCPTFLFAAAKSLQSCPTLCDPIDSSPPSSSIPGILQARTLEWVASSFSNAWKWKVKVKSLSHVQLFATPWTVAHQAPPSMGFSRQEYWSGLPLPSSLGMVNNHWMEICFDNNVQAPLSLDLHTGKLSQFIKL